MRPTPYTLQAIGRPLFRNKSISFIGLGRMGYEMAYNLFSKTYAEANDSHFVVCDAVQETSQKFCSSFLTQFPRARIGIATTPEEYVLV